MTLKLEKIIIGNAMGRVPTVPDRNFFVFTISQFFSLEAIVLDVVYRLKNKNREVGLNEEDKPNMKRVVNENSSYDSNGCGDAEDAVVEEEGFACLLLHVVHALVGAEEGPHHKLV